MAVYLRPVSNQRLDAATPADIEALARQLYERTCRNDTFDDLKRRAAFDRQDAGRLRHWIRVAESFLANGLRPRS